jgi:dihydroorotate dehydrogenase (fumarate)
LGQLQTTISGLIRLRTGGPAISVAASGGISTAKDVVHAVIAGADVVMVTSEIYRTGPDAIAHILEGVIHYLQREGLDSFDSFVAQSKAANGKAQTRQSQIHPMTHPEDYRDPHPEPAQQSGDRWGHSYPSPMDE